MTRTIKAYKITDADGNVTYMPRKNMNPDSLLRAQSGGFTVSPVTVSVAIPDSRLLEIGEITEIADLPYA